MKLPVLIVDDHFSSRKKGYQRLAAEVSKVPGFDIKLDFLEHPNQLTSMIARNHYVAAIVDAVLDEAWPNFTIGQALKVLGDTVPIALISERWDKTNSKEIDEAWKKPNCRTFLHWRDLSDDQRNGQIDYSVRSFISMIADFQRVNAHARIEPNDAIKIVHISDLQTGGVDSNQLRLEANRCADQILDYWDETPPHFVAFTGDVSEHGMPEQYDSARQWVGYFLARLGLESLPTQRILYVPGNHDVNLSLGAAARVTAVKNKRAEKVTMKLNGEVVRSDLLTYAYAPFRKFLESVTDCPLLEPPADLDSLAWVESRFRHLGVVFYGLNTAQPTSSFGLPGRRVNANALAQIDTELKEVIKNCDKNSPPLVIGLSHHCPISASGDDAIDNPKEFSKFFGGKVKTALFLHGHSHEHSISYGTTGTRSKVRLVRSCATTLTKREAARPPDSLRGFNLLELKRESGSVTSLEACSFGWIGTEIVRIDDDSTRQRWIRQSDGMFREAI